MIMCLTAVLLLPLGLFEAAADSPTHPPSLHRIDPWATYGDFPVCGSIGFLVRPPIVSPGLVQASLQVQ